MDERARDVIDGFNRLKSNRGTWENHWQQITELCLPERNDYTVMRTPGMKRNQQIFNEVPEFALNQFANGLHSLLTSPSLPWFALHCDDDRLDQMREVRIWLEAASNEMYSIFAGPRNNFASQSHEYYLDLGSIGTAVMAALESERDKVMFSTRHLKECVVEENDEDRVDSLTRRWSYTPKQAYQAWGKDAGTNVLKLYMDGSDKPLHYFHRVRPRKDRNPDRMDGKNMPFESIYVGEEDGNIVKEGGFSEFPYLVSRFSKTAGEIYGRGPGMTMLPLMKMLNEATKLVIKAAQKVVDPPLQIPDDGYLLPIKTVPGSQNFFRANSPVNARIAPIATGGRIDIGDEMVTRWESKILRGFFVEWMMMPVADPSDPNSAGKGVTATWVLEQRDKKMQMLSPMLARLQSEFLGPLIERTFNILWKRSIGMRFGYGSPFPQPPDILRGQKWHPTYVSPIAIAQKSSELDSVGRMLQQQLMLRQINPEAQIIIDDQAIMRRTMRDLNAPADSLKSPEALAAEAKQKQGAEGALNGSEVAGKMAGALSDTANAAKAMSEAQA